jgi:succinate dehydrogenase / fumarate reductase, cytochrome b subunit
MPGTEDSAGSTAEQLAHGRPAVERWLTWSGLIPLPVFLVLHLGRELGLAFATDVSDVLRPPPGLLSTATSWLLVWLPLAVHVGLAVWLAVGARKPSTLAGDVARVPRTLSRVSSLLALIFLAYHARTYSVAVWLGEADARDGGFRLVAELSSTRFGVPLVAAAYLLGLLATVTHGGLGLHRGLLAEGFLRDPRRRRASARACAAFGVACFCLGAAAVIRVASGLILR